MEFTSLDRCAAYVSARAALEAACAHNWPTQALADVARRAALTAAASIAQAMRHHHRSAERRACLASALRSSLDLSAVCDRTPDPGDVPAFAGRAIAQLALLFHASANPIPEPTDEFVRPEAESRLATSCVTRM